MSGPSRWRRAVGSLEPPDGTGLRPGLSGPLYVANVLVVETERASRRPLAPLGNHDIAGTLVALDKAAKLSRM